MMKKKMAGEILHWNINGLKCNRSPNYKAKLDKIKSFLDNEKTLVLNIKRPIYLVKLNYQIF